MSPKCFQGPEIENAPKYARRDTKWKFFVELATPTRYTLPICTLGTAILAPSAFDLAPYSPFPDHGRIQNLGLGAP